MNIQFRRRDRTHNSEFYSSPTAMPVTLILHDPFRKRTAESNVAKYYSSSGISVSLILHFAFIMKE